MAAVSRMLTNRSTLSERCAAGCSILARRLPAAIAWIGLRGEIARQRRALAALDDRLLRDIGLTRDNVAQETGKPFWYL